MRDKRTVLGKNLAAIAPVRPRLFAADIELFGAVECATFQPALARVRCCVHQRFQLALGARVGLQAFPPALATKPTFTHPTKAGGSVKQVRGINPDNPRCKLWRDAQSKVHILAPNRRRKPIARIVGEAHCLLWCAEGCGHQNRPEYLLLHELRARRKPRDQRRRIEAPLHGQFNGCCVKLSFIIGGDHICDRLELHRIHNRPNVDRFVHR